MSQLLKVSGLTTAFTGDYGTNISVDHIDFTVNEGETVCIVGESGCGKSVTMLSVMGLLGRGGKVTGGKALFEEHHAPCTGWRLDSGVGRFDRQDYG